MSVSDEALKRTIADLLRMPTGFYVGFANLLEIGQLENLNYWVTSRDSAGVELWHVDDIELEEAIEHFLRIRSERLIGFDLEWK